MIVYWRNIWTTYILQRKLSLIIMILITYCHPEHQTRTFRASQGLLAAESCQLCYLFLITIYPVADKISATARITGLLSAAHAHTHYRDMASRRRWRTGDIIQETEKNNKHMCTLNPKIFPILLMFSEASSIQYPPTPGIRIWIPETLTEASI